MTGNVFIRNLAAATMSLALAWTVLAPRTVAVAGEQPNLLVVGDDADQDTVPRNSRIFNRVLAALIGDMNERGFKVYDETAASMDITNPGRVRRTDAELISIAQRIPKPPIDVIVVFQVYASVQQNAYSDIKGASHPHSRPHDPGADRQDAWQFRSGDGPARPEAVAGQLQPRLHS